MPKRSKETKHKQKMKEKFKKNSKATIKLKSKNASTNPNRVAPGDVNQQSNLRTKATIKRLNMYREKPDYEKMRERPKDGSVRIQPDRKWFGNIRTIDQKSLEKFRAAIEQKSQKPIKPNEILITKKKLPMSLLVNSHKESRQNKTKLLQLESYNNVFGPNKQRKKVKLDVYDTDQLAQQAEQKLEQYEMSKDVDIMKGQEQIKLEEKDKRMEAGQSKRIWEELTKVIDASDVICQVIDARDPMGTRSKHIEQFLQKKFPSKHLVLILNKIDLIPISITKKWLRYLSKQLPTVAYHANINNPFGKGSLINLFRQFDNFHKDKQTISVGFIGYPNVGKSSVINSIKHKKVCKSAPVPGETKVWQYIHLTKRIYMIDCPGIVYNYEGLDVVQNVLKSVIRAERLVNPEDFIGNILELVNKKTISQLYGIEQWESPEEFISLLARKKGRLLKGAEPDISTTAKQIIYDWQAGIIPYFVSPPDEPQEKGEREIEEQIRRMEEKEGTKKNQKKKEIQQINS